MAKKYETMEATELRLSILKYKKDLKKIKNVGLYMFTTKEHIFIKLVDLSKTYKSYGYILVEIKATDFNIQTSNNSILHLIAAPGIKIETQSANRLRILLTSVIKQNDDNTLDPAKAFLTKLLEMPTFDAAYDATLDLTKYSSELYKASKSRMTLDMYNTIFSNNVDLSDSLKKAIDYEKTMIDKQYKIGKTSEELDSDDHTNVMQKLRTEIHKRWDRSQWF